MAELEGLKKRVELVDLRLKTAHSARERESAALMDMWQKIRDRLQDQSAEIVKLRDQVSELEDARNELLKIVHGLLSAVEGGLDSIADETVPKIKAMAGQLLGENAAQSRPAAAAPAPVRSEFAGEDSEDDAYDPAYDPYADEDDTPAVKSAAESSFRDDLLRAMERSADGANADDVIGEPPRPARKLNGAAADTPPIASPGIRNLVARIEDAVGEDFLDPPFASREKEPEPEPDDELSRDLREIEALRNELLGLRHRVASGAY